MAKHKQRSQPTSRELLLQDISASLLLSNREGSQPEYQSDALAAAVAAATTAAASLARMQVAQYAELAQQLQQAKQNPNKRPGRKGKGVKKLLKKHKVLLVSLI
jgi:tripartite-type tricarboxylate transporter receptor subunit TctC